MSDKNEKNIWHGKAQFSANRTVLPNNGRDEAGHAAFPSDGGFVVPRASFAEVARGLSGRHDTTRAHNLQRDVYSTGNAEEKQNNSNEWFQDKRDQDLSMPGQMNPQPGFQKMAPQQQWQHYTLPHGTMGFTGQSDVPFASMTQATYHNSGAGDFYGPRNSRSLNNEESGQLFGQPQGDMPFGYRHDAQEIATLGVAANHGPLYGNHAPQFLGKDAGFSPQFGEVMNPRPSQLYPLEAHSLGAFSQHMGNLSLGLQHDEYQGHNYSGKDSHPAYAAQPLHNTHQSWNQHARPISDQMHDKSDMVSYSLDDRSVLSSSRQSNSNGNSLDGQKRSSSESGGGSDYGAPKSQPMAASFEMRQGDRFSRSSNDNTKMQRPRPRAGNESRNTKGYRKLWQHVTNVNKGARLANQRYQSGDTTVEDLLDIVMALPNEVSSIPAVANGLHVLDAGALAALLKELNRNKCSHRAQEIFDWLRDLENNNPLRQLCTTMTYTTMISQCGAQHALRRAMELMAEMKSRGISCNVHTYSALMNVCIKTGELNLALDVYKEMLNEGCTPNLVTFNTLIDVYGKTGQWEEAIAVLDAVEEKGLEPEARTYNTAIIACNQSSRAKEALQVYERMLKAQAKPTATTYTALISAYGKAGQLDQALEIFQSMEQYKCEKNVITYSSLISACEKAGEWQLALKLFNDMHNDGCQPNVVTYNALIAACAQGAQAEKAQQIFDLMRKRGCRPDSVTFGALIGAYDKSGNWRNALSSFEVTCASGCKPDTVVYNTIIGCLWRTGILRAQEGAMKIFHFACKQGHFRMTVNADKDTSSVRQGSMETSQSLFTTGQGMMPMSTLRTNDGSSNACTEYGMHAFTIGSAILCLYRWLYEIKVRSITDGEGTKGERVVLTLNKGKPSREHTYPIIKEALLAKIKSWKMPLDLSDVSIGCQISGEISELLQSLAKSEPKSSLERFIALANHEIPSSRAIYQDDAITEARCVQAFRAVRQFESLNVDSENKKKKAGGIGDQHRLFLDMGALAESCNYPEDILYDAFDILMRFIEHGGDIKLIGEHELVGACFLLAVEQSSFDTEDADGVGFLRQDNVRRVCHDVKTRLNGKMSSISSSRVLKLYLERLGVCFEGKSPTYHPVAGVSFSLLPRSVSKINMRTFPSSISAGAVLISGRKSAGISPFWPQTLELMTGYKFSEGTELSKAVKQMSSLPADEPFDT